MLRTTLITSLAAALMLGIGAGITPAQSIAPVYDQDDYDRAQVDRYLDVELWTSNSDGEFYEGDDIVIYFRASRDAFVSIYSIDTRGRVNLLFPTYFGEDNFVNGGVTYSLPGGQEDYDLVVSGPEGFENIQIIASREQFPIPDWYNGPELVVNDGEDRDDYMDWVNGNHFVDYGGQRFAYDRAVVYVNEWEETYFRPIYYPSYPSWTVYGNCYIDYPWGGSIYVNGIYWGCAPLYIPRIAVGWHTITIYDPYGYCWEHDFHVSHYNTVVFNRTVIQTSSSVKSKYKEVREAGYRNPSQSGYPDFESRKNSVVTSLGKSGRVGTKSGSANLDDVDFSNTQKKFVRGSTKVVKTDRGYETDASTAVFPEKGGKVGSTTRSRDTRSYESTKGQSGSSGSSERGASGTKYRKPSSESGTVGGSSSGSGKKSSPSGTSGSSPRIERRKSSGKSEAVSVPKQGKSSTSSGKTESKPAEAGKKKESAPAPAPAPAPAKVKSSDGGSSSSSSSKPQSQGGQKSSGGGGGKKK